MTEFYTILLNLTAPAILGLVAWIWLLWRSHHALQLKVAEEYVRKDGLNEIKNEIKDDINSLRELMYRIAGRLEVPVITRT